MSAETSHTRDFSEVVWFGERYEFSPPQAACMAVLWRLWQSGTPIIREAEVLSMSRQKARTLREIFRSSPGEIAWGKLIATGDRRGTVRLAEPEAAQPLNE